MNGALRWGVAMGGLLMSHNEADLTILGGIRRHDPAEQESVKESLNRDWGIESRDDIVNILEWLLTEGHRAELVMLCAMDDQGVDPDDIDDEDDEDLERKLAFVHRHRDRFVRAGLLAWDANRLVVLAGFGAYAGYLTTDEAWRHIMGMAFLVQHAYGSWAECGAHHLLGYEYWCGQWDGDFARHYRKLLDSPESPWRTLPWATDLRGHGLQGALPPATHLPAPPRQRPA